MPTGYTADVADGKVTDFRTFALRCARAFGATIMQRDDPTNDPPKHREPSSHYAERLAAARQRMAELDATSLADAETLAAAEYEKAVADYEAAVARQADIRNRYNAMLAEVMEWTAPTPDHRPLRAFMVKQLTESRDSDAYEPERPTRPTAVEWLAKEWSEAARNVSYYEQNAAAEAKQCAEANAWIDALYASLPVEVGAGAAGV